MSWRFALASLTCRFWRQPRQICRVLNITNSYVLHSWRQWLKNFLHFFARSCTLIGNEGTAQLLLAIRLLKNYTHRRLNEHSCTGWILNQFNSTDVFFEVDIGCCPSASTTPYHPSDLAGLLLSLVQHTQDTSSHPSCVRLRGIQYTAVLLQKYHPAIFSLLRLLR